MKTKLLRKDEKGRKVGKSIKDVSLSSLEENWSSMYSTQDTVEISSEKDSPLRLVVIEEEVASMQVGSLKKRKVQKPISPASKK